MQQFFDFPRKEFLIREISRNTKLAQTSVRLQLKSLIADDVVKKETAGLYPSFRANRDSALFKLLKTQNIVFRLHQCKVIEHLEKAFYPSCIILFGSASRGEDTETSDIDLFIQAKYATINLEKFGKALNRKINLLFEPNIDTISPELINNLVNGYGMYGYFKVK